MSLVFVFAATRMEGVVVKRLMRDRTHPGNVKALSRGEVGDNEVLLVNTGMGPENARTAARRVFEEPAKSDDEFSRKPATPEAALVIGLAGSLVPSICEGDIVIYRNCLTSENRDSSIACSAPLIELMRQSLQSQGLNATEVTGITSSRIAGHDQRRRYMAETGATVVDMESFEIAACAASAGVPVAVLRAISDGPGSRMPDLNRALTASGTFDRWRLTTVLAASPLATVRLFRSSHLAIGMLRRAVGAILSSAFGNIGRAETMYPEIPAGSACERSVVPEFSECPGGFPQVQK